MSPLDVRLMNALTAVLLLAFAAMALVLALHHLARQPAFVLQKIQIDSELVHNNAVTLRANVAPKLAGNFFTLNLEQAKAAFEAIPWVRQAVVRREFPNRLRVQLQEHQAVALWGLDDEVRLINHLGEVFEINQGDVEAESLPRLAGPRAQSALVLQAYRELAPLLAGLDAELSLLELTGRGGWRARLDSGAVIEIGPGGVPDIAQRVRRFVATVSQTSSRFGRNIESADLRYPNGYALRLRGVTTVDGDRASKTTR
jgi:cell division protein FtsQ